MKKPFSMKEHVHDLWNYRCRSCHRHTCSFCGYMQLCSADECKVASGGSVGMESVECIFCLGEISADCHKCGSRYHTVFPKCPYCFFKEMKAFWEKSFLPGKKRICRCNRCGG